MRRLLLFLLFSVLGWSQSPTSIQATTFTATGSGAIINLSKSGVTNHKLIWYVKSNSTCAVTLDSSADGVTFSTGGAITSQTCTSSGASALTNVTSPYVQVTVGTLTGTGAQITIVYLGYNTIAGTINGGAFPTSAKLLSSNSSAQPVAAAAATSPIAVSATGGISCSTCAIGPGSSTANHVASFSGTDGLTLADSGLVAGSLPQIVCRYTTDVTNTNNGTTANIINNGTLSPTCPIASGKLGANSSIIVYAQLYALSSNTGTCTFRVEMNTSVATGVSDIVVTDAMAAARTGVMQFAISNRNSVSSQVAGGFYAHNSNLAGATTAPVTYSYNTGTTQTYLLFIVTNSVATDSCTLNQATVVLYP